MTIISGTFGVLSHSIVYCRLSALYFYLVCIIIFFTVSKYYEWHKVVIIIEALSKKYFQVYSRAMKTQHPNVHQYLRDILNILSQRISGDFMNTKKNRLHNDFISFNAKSPNVYTHAHFPTEVKHFQNQHLQT